MDESVTVELTTPDGETSDITRLIHEETEKMATETKAVNAEAVELIAGACRERINEMIDDLVNYVDASEAAGKMTLSISLTPDPKVEGAYHLAIVPGLAVKGMHSEGAASIERVGKHKQLKIAGM